MHLLFLSVVLALRAFALNTTVDSMSPRVVYTPKPCFQGNVSGCWNDWRTPSGGGTWGDAVVLTTGEDPARPSDDIIGLPSLSLTFQGTDIVFNPGPKSTAQAIVSVDGNPSKQFSTQSAYKVTGLSAAQNHTISITFVKSEDDTTLSVRNFQISQPDSEVTSTPASASLTTTPTATELTSPAPSESGTPHPPISVGTIAAVSLSGAIVLVLGLLVCFCAARRRRRHEAVRRERAILYDLHLPSDGQGKLEKYKGSRNARQLGDHDRGSVPRDRAIMYDLHLPSDEKGKLAKYKGDGNADVPSRGRRREKDWELDGYYRGVTDEKGKPSNTDLPELEWRIASPPPSLRAARKYSVNGSLR